MKTIIIDENYEHLHKDGELYTVLEWPTDAESEIQVTVPVISYGHTAIICKEIHFNKDCVFDNLTIIGDVAFKGIAHINENLTVIGDMSMLHHDLTMGDEYNPILNKIKVTETLSMADAGFEYSPILINADVYAGHIEETLHAAGYITANTINAKDIYSNKRIKCSDHCEAKKLEAKLSIECTGKIVSDDLTVFGVKTKTCNSIFYEGYQIYLLDQHIVLEDIPIPINGWLKFIKTLEVTPYSKWAKQAIPMLQKIKKTLKSL
jgi:hypothetical protein